MSAATTIVGVDVGGTFTDLFFFDEATRRFRTAKVPSNRGDEAVGFLEGLRSWDAVRGVRLHRARHHRRHQCPAGAQGRAHRGHHHARLSRRAGDAPPRPAAAPGAVGRFRARRRRDMRIEVAERTLADGTIRDGGRPRRGPRAAQRLARTGRAGGRDRLHQRLRQPGQRTCRRAAAVRAIWPNPDVATSREILPEIREFERASTTALNAYLQPVVALSGQARTALQRRPSRAVPHRAVQWRRHVDRDGAAAAGAHRAIGPGGGRHRGRRHRPRGRVPERHHRRPRRHLLRRVADRRAARRSLAAQTTIDFGLVIRTPMIEITTIGAGGGSIAHVDRGRPAAGGPGKRRLRPRARSATARARTGRR